MGTARQKNRLSVEASLLGSVALRDDLAINVVQPYDVKLNVVDHAARPLLHFSHWLQRLTFVLW